MIYVIDKKHLRVLICLITEALTQFPNWRFDESNLAYYLGDDLIAFFNYQGANYVSLFIMESEAAGALQKAATKFALPAHQPRGLRNVNPEKAHKILLKRTGIDIRKKPRYFLHGGAVEVIVRDGCAVVAAWGGAEELKHAEAVCRLLQEAVERG